jgi:hypothetical protein
VTEAVRLVACDGGLDAEAAADPPAEEEVPHERLTPDEDLVRQHIPRAGLEPPRREQRTQAVDVVRSHVGVVLEDDTLAVERERAEGLVALERVEDAVDDGAEAQPEDLERDVPLPVPVGVRNDEVADAPSLSGRCGARL